MNKNQKRRITLMRKNHIGYAAIANELKLSLSTVKSFCRRHNLQARDLVNDTLIDNLDRTSSENDLICIERRGNSTTAKQPRIVENKGIPGNQHICEVTVSYADEPDFGAVADVLGLLAHANYGRS